MTTGIGNRWDPDDPPEVSKGQPQCLRCAMLERNLAEAARAIPEVAGPVAHRIRMMRTSLSDHIIDLERQVEQLQNSIMRALDLTAEGEFPIDYEAQLHDLAKNVAEWRKAQEQV